MQVDRLSVPATPAPQTPVSEKMLTPWDGLVATEPEPLLVCTPAPSPDALLVSASDLPESPGVPASAGMASETKPIISGGLATIPLLCLGIGLIACCILIPAADENRRLVYERQRLQNDLDQITRQIETNDEFLKRIADDPGLAERLAQRQMKMVRQGTSVLELKGASNEKDMSPFELVTLPPP